MNFWGSRYNFDFSKFNDECFLYIGIGLGLFYGIRILNHLMKIYKAASSKPDTAGGLTSANEKNADMELTEAHNDEAAEGQEDAKEESSEEDKNTSEVDKETSEVDKKTN